MAKISGTGSIRLPAIAAGLALILASGANAAGQRAAGQHGGGHGHTEAGMKGPILIKSCFVPPAHGTRPVRQ
jgi:hypothetical protein